MELRRSARLKYYHQTPAYHLGNSSDDEEASDFSAPEVEERESYHSQSDEESLGRSRLPSDAPKRHLVQRPLGHYGESVIPDEAVGYLPLEEYPTDTGAVGNLPLRYLGPVPRNSNSGWMARHWGASKTGPSIAALAKVLERWIGAETFPPREKAVGPIISPWVSENVWKEQTKRWVEWHKRSKMRGKQNSVVLGGKSGQQYHPSQNTSGSLRELLAFLGPFDAQAEYRFEPGDCMSVNYDCVPDNDNPSGWILDAGGIVLSMDWAPQHDDGPQVLALSAIPHSDQEMRNWKDGRPPPDPDSEKSSVQLWLYKGEDKDRCGTMVPSLEKAVRIRTLCLDWGRVRQLAWCPVPPPKDLFGLLGVLSADGRVRVVEVPVSGEHNYDNIVTPFAALYLPDEDSVDATAFTWINTNRVAIGHADGSVVLWSISPLRILSRHPVGHTLITSMTSCYPSHPYIIAVLPISEVYTLIDLTRPSAEISAFPCPSLVAQPNLLSWSDHLQAFVAPVPTSTPLATSLVLLNVRQFPLARRVLMPSCSPTAAAVGSKHPFILAGLADGSVWMCNPVRRMFGSRYSPGQKVRVMQHEFRPAVRLAGEGRGVVRILQGWVGETNLSRPPPLTKTKSNFSISREPGGYEEGEGDDEFAVNPSLSALESKKGKQNPGEPEIFVANEERGLGDELRSQADPRRRIVHEALTRITAVAWNPNVEYGCWAAIAMGSGLVRVMDLGTKVRD